MAPAAASVSSASFARSHSSPELQSTPSFRSRPPLPRNSPSLNKELPRLPSFESFEIPSFDSIGDLDTKLSLPGAAAPRLDSSPVIIPATSKPSNTDADEHAGRFKLGLSRSKTTKGRPKSWLPSFKSNKEENVQPVQHLELPSPGDGAMARHPSLKERGQSATDTFANFARRSWISRSPSPKIITPPATDNASDKTPKAAPKSALSKPQPTAQPQ
ncbi:hypothetical protein NLG97_g7996 [Lecanicillium saksenae]|uniref:Uncharacterized protein n=1 Tax=Lecanicillium saksenae TaxID=468837 RepID=A0ACC1QM47_9HYPO|nr:hypothetical protein NLG97_g7996 [Lecanicillium saksenae]